MMSLSTTGVSIVLLIIWGIAYFTLKNKLYTTKIYFALLFVMGCAGILLPELPLMGLSPNVYYLSNIILFALLMLITIIPWISFDRLFKHKPVFSVKDKYIPLLKNVFVVTIIISFIAIIYLLPFAITSMMVGAQEIRSTIMNESILPQTIFTTIFVGVAALYPITIFLVFISLLDVRLEKYTILLIVSSFTYLAANTAITGRDGFIFIPLIYIVLFCVFKYSINKKLLSNIKRDGIIAATMLIFVIGSVTINRFYDDSTSKSKENSTERLIYGTWGYFYQQPYVFDHVMDDFDSFYGFKRRLKFLDGTLGVNGMEYDRFHASLYEFMFGTQYAEFYQISGYSSLIIMTIIFLWLFRYLAIRFRRRGNIFALLMCFAIYLNFTISGMFYFRLGNSDGEFFLNIAILLTTFFIPNIIQIKGYASNQIE